MRKALTVATALLFAAGAAQAAGTKTVGDWDAVCSNTSACVATGFSSDAADADAYLQVRRGAGPTAAPVLVLTFDPGDAQPSATWTITLDGRPVAGIGPISAAGSGGGAQGRIRGAAALALVDALRNGKSLEIHADGKVLGAVSLTGSAAILLWVDDQQGRVGTVTALVGKGPKPASAAPPATPKPLILAAPPVSQARLPKSAPRSMTKGVLDCDLDPSITPDDLVARLTLGVVLWGPECTTGAYNVLNIFFLGDEKGGHLKRVVFPEAPGVEQTGDDVLMNVGFDAKAQTLSSFSKGRGIGDCGAMTTWVWNGKVFRLLSEYEMPDCRGVASGDWPALFEARSH